MKTIERKVKEEVCAYEEKIKERIKLLNLAIDDIRDSLRQLREQYTDVATDIYSIYERLELIDETLAK